MPATGSIKDNSCDRQALPDNHDDTRNQEKHDEKFEKDAEQDVEGNDDVPDAALRDSDSEEESVYGYKPAIGSTQDIETESIKESDGSFATIDGNADMETNGIDNNSDVENESNTHPTLAHGGGQQNIKRTNSTKSFQPIHHAFNPYAQIPIIDNLAKSDVTDTLDDGWSDDELVSSNDDNYSTATNTMHPDKDALSKVAKTKKSDAMEKDTHINEDSGINLEEDHDVSMAGTNDFKSTNDYKEADVQPSKQGEGKQFFLNNPTISYLRKEQNQYFGRTRSSNQSRQEETLKKDARQIDRSNGIDAMDMEHTENSTLSGNLESSPNRTTVKLRQDSKQRPKKGKEKFAGNPFADVIKHIQDKKESISKRGDRQSNMDGSTRVAKATSIQPIENPTNDVTSEKSTMATKEDTTMEMPGAQTNTIQPSAMDSRELTPAQIAVKQFFDAKKSKQQAEEKSRRVTIEEPDSGEFKEVKTKSKKAKPTMEDYRPIVGFRIHKLADATTKSEKMVDLVIFLELLGKMDSTAILYPHNKDASRAVLVTDLQSIQPSKVKYFFDYSVENWGAKSEEKYRLTMSFYLQTDEISLNLKEAHQNPLIKAHLSTTGWQLTSHVLHESADKEIGFFVGKAVEHTWRDGMAERLARHLHDSGVDVPVAVRDKCSRGVSFCGI